MPVMRVPFYMYRYYCGSCVASGLHVIFRRPNCWASASECMSIKDYSCFLDSKMMGTTSVSSRDNTMDRERALYFLKWGV